jgi:hypothetical protein
VIVSVVVGDNVAAEIVWGAISVTRAGPNTHPGLNKTRLDVRPHYARRVRLFSATTASSNQVDKMEACDK